MEKSYFLFAPFNNTISQGTGFLVKKNNELYLITAAHNFHTDKSSKVKTTDVFYIRVFNFKNEPHFLQINNEPIIKSSKYSNLDINVYNIQIPDIFQINTVDVQTKNGKIDNVICFGYAVVDGNDDNPTAYVNELLPTEFRGFCEMNYDKPIKYDDGELDYQNYVVKYISGSLGKGTSGSPVFCVNKTDGKCTFEFAGLIHTRNEIHKQATIIRREIIEDFLNTL